MERINKTQARKLYNEGVAIRVVPCKVAPTSNLFGARIKKDEENKDFDNVVNSVQFYQCNYETGYRLHYYVESLQGWSLYRSMNYHAYKTTTTANGVQVTYYFCDKVKGEQLEQYEQLKKYDNISFRFSRCEYAPEIVKPVVRVLEFPTIED